MNLATLMNFVLNAETCMNLNLIIIGFVIINMDYQH